MSEADPERRAELVIDTRGLVCPLPILKIKKVLREAGYVTKVRILATDPLAQHDIKAFCEAERYFLHANRRLPDRSFEFCIEPRP